MALAIPTTEPLTFRQGELVEWTRDLSDFPASAWTLIYTFRSPSHKFTVTATADGDTHAAKRFIKIDIAKLRTQRRGPIRQRRQVHAGIAERSGFHLCHLRSPIA